jgi:hypothetical protein
VFRGVDRRWHARIGGADKPVMVHGDDLVDLREEIIRKISQLEECATGPPAGQQGTWSAH